MRRRSLVQVGGAAAAAVLGLTVAVPSAPAAVELATPKAAPNAATNAAAKAAGRGLANKLVRKVRGQDANRHLIAFQRIADRNGGNRSAGSPGYDASVEYAAGKLRQAGFRVRTPEFPFIRFEPISASLTVGGTSYEIDHMTASRSTPVGGVTAPLRVVPEDATTGCEAADYAGQDFTGTIALIRRGGCTFFAKGEAAAAAGAAAAIISNNVPGPLSGTLGEPVPIPVGGISQADGNTLAALAGQPATLDLQALLDEDAVTHNLIAQTRTGSRRNVVMAGAHLDSVPAGPGINDNGSGSAALLDLALKLGGRPNVNNMVRFGWWGAEESNLVGSTAYVEGLTFERQLDIAMYLNFDMVASPNAGYFVYDGDDSDEAGAGPGPYGSAQIEQTFNGFFADRLDVPTEGKDFDGRSDYGPFIEVGIPSGGLFTGAEVVKTADQAAKWGGTAGIAFDPCYHQACDNLGNVDRVALDRNLDAMAWATGLYAKSTRTINGVPPRAQRAALRTAAARSSALGRVAGGAIVR
jgi:Zn-dependent M28 family amino/carboxypeptidase